MPEELITVQELTSRLKISRRQLERLRHEGLPCIKIKSAPRFEYQSVVTWLKQQNHDSNVAQDYEFM